MKRWGFLTGAAIASIGVWLFYALTTVTDEDRLAAVLTQHCLPYVQTGATPFGDLGRSPGVFDNLNLNTSIEGGGARLIFEGRFAAQWGLAQDANSDVRVCAVQDIYARADSKGFEVPPHTLTEFIDDLLPADLGLAPVPQDLAPLPRVLAWTQNGKTTDDGLRLFLTEQVFGVSDVLMLQDAPTPQ